jgi:hypothetical protein
MKDTTQASQEAQSHIEYKFSIRDIGNMDPRALVAEHAS